LVLFFCLTIVFFGNHYYNKKIIGVNMDKKTVATTIFACLIVVFIMLTGATISAYKVSKEKVEVSKIDVFAGSGVLVTDKDGNNLTTLKVKSSAVGVRPATGEEDNDTSIPTTVNDAVGTEGAYATFCLTAQGDYQIILKNCSLTNGEENLKNVRVAIMEEENEAICGCYKGAVLAKGTNANNKETVVVVWLDKPTTKTIKGAKISLELEILVK